jgi:very-short-patch-repair endonuclease
MARDRARDRAAAAGGWLTLRVLDSEVAQDPAGVLRDLEAAYRSRVALLMP